MTYMSANNTVEPISMALDTLVVYEVLPESLQVDNFEFSIPPPPPLPLPLSIMPLLLFSSYLADFMGGGYGRHSCGHRSCQIQYEFWYVTSTDILTALGPYTQRFGVVNAIFLTLSWNLLGGWFGCVVAFTQLVNKTNAGVLRPIVPIG